jgi:hypothetical protein
MTSRVEPLHGRSVMSSDPPDEIPIRPDDVPNELDFQSIIREKRIGSVTDGTTWSRVMLYADQNQLSPL